MKLKPDDLISQLSMVVDPSLARTAVESFVEMQQRFLAGDWQPTELDGGRLCEAVARCLLQLDQGKVDHKELPGAICDALIDERQQRSHNLQVKDRNHVAKTIKLVYKFRSDRGAVHISPIYTANYMDSMLMVHAGKWVFAEFLRLAWKQDRKVIAEIIEQLVQLEHSIIHELDGRPLVLAKGVSAPDEVLVLLYRAPNNRLSRAELRSYAYNQKPATINVAVSRLINSRDVRPADNDEVALTPIGQKRVLNVILPKH